MADTQWEPEKKEKRPSAVAQKQLNSEVNGRPASIDLSITTPAALEPLAVAMTDLLLLVPEFIKKRMNAKSEGGMSKGGRRLRVFPLEPDALAHDGS